MNAVDEAAIQRAAEIIPRLYRVNRNVTPEQMLLGVTWCALAHWHLLEDSYRRDLRYASAEGLDVVEVWRSAMARSLNETKTDD